MARVKNGAGADSHVVGLPRWFIRLVLAGLMYAFLVAFVMVLSSRGWHMIPWLVAGVSIQAGMLTLAALTDPKRRR